MVHTDPNEIAAIAGGLVDAEVCNCFHESSLYCTNNCKFQFNAEFGGFERFAK